MQNGTTDEQWSRRIDTSGRLALPQPVRIKQGLQSGDELIVSIEDGAIVLRSYEEAMRRLQNAFCEGIPDNVSLSGELMKERRAEATRGRNC